MPGQFWPGALVTGNHRFGLRQHHMVVLLIQRLLRIHRAGRQRANHLAFEDHHVLFIDGQPVFHPVTIVLETGDGEALKGGHGAPV